MRLLALFALIAAVPAFGAEPETHWSLRPRTRPAVPEIRDPKFALRTPVDAFILAKLEKEGFDRGRCRNFMPGRVIRRKSRRGFEFRVF